MTLYIPTRQFTAGICACLLMMMIQFDEICTPHKWMQELQVAYVLWCPRLNLRGYVQDDLDKNTIMHRQEEVRSTWNKNLRFKCLGFERGDCLNGRKRSMPRAYCYVLIASGLKQIIRSAFLFQCPYPPWLVCVCLYVSICVCVRSKGKMLGSLWDRSRKNDVVLKQCLTWTFCR